MCHVNVRSLLAVTRAVDLEILCANHSVDVLCVSETWLNSSRVRPGDSRVNLAGFHAPVRHDRPSGRPGGGVAIYVRHGLCAVPVRLDDNLEAACVELRINSRKKLRIVTVYRPPKSDFDAFLSHLDSALSALQAQARHPLCLVGDFNVRCSTWWNGQTSTSDGLRLESFACTQGLTQIVDGPTHAIGTPHAAQLDLMFVCDASLVQASCTLPPVADHCPTLMQLSLKSTAAKVSRRSYLDFAKADIPMLIDYLQSADWSDVYSSTNPVSALDSWYNVVQDALLKFVPHSTMVIRPRSKPWYSSYLRRLARERDRLYRRSQHLSSGHRLSAAYRRVRNWYVAELRHAERSYYLRLGHRLTSKEMCPHRWWSVAKSACGLQNRDTIPTLIDSGRAVFSSIGKAECLNKFFAAQCSAPCATPPVCSESEPTSEFKFSPISTTDVLKHLASLNVWKASGLDGLSNLVLKECRTAIAEPLTYVFNLSLSSGKFPAVWKKAAVQPVFKRKGDRCDASSYRPIALLPSVSKILERFVHKQLLSFCLDVGAIPDEQYGFLPGRSTVWQLLAVLDDWEAALDEGHSVHACFLDVAKAFDRVDHGLLLHKLQRIGLSDVPLEWFTSYLHGRSICTVVDGVNSTRLPISSGVPQGSVLGPLLFIIYFGDLPDSVSTSSALYADDTLVYDRNCCALQDPSPASPQCCLLRDDIERLDTWSASWNTTFNAEKSAHMLISWHPSDTVIPTLALDNNSVPYAHEVKHLGLVITSSLRWSTHIHNLLLRVGYRIHLLKRLAYRVASPLFVKQLYVCLLRPSLEYASPVWDGACLKKDSLVLERAQLSVARAILRRGRRCASNREVLEEIGWPTLAWRRRRSKLSLLWQLFHGQGPPSLQKVTGETAAVRTAHDLRNQLRVAHPLCRTKRRAQSFLPSTIAVWNQLPSDLCSSSSLPSFLSKLDHHFSADRFSFGLT